MLAAPHLKIISPNNIYPKYEFLGTRSGSTTSLRPLSLEKFKLGGWETFCLIMEMQTFDGMVECIFVTDIYNWRRSRRAKSE